MALEGALMKRIALGLSAATGGLLAVWGDAAQKPLESNDIDHLKAALGHVLGSTPYEWIVVVALIAISVAISFIFNADTYKKAFYSGASVLAIMMTGTPYSLPPSPPVPQNSGASAAGPQNSGGSAQLMPPGRGWWGQLMIPAAVFAQSPAQQNAQVTVHLETSDKKAVNAALFTILDSGNGQVMFQSKVSGSDFTFYVPNRPCTLRVQVDGYGIEERALNQSMRTLTISLRPTSIPLSVQRLFRR